MENEHALNALLRKRAELAGQFEHHQAKARQLLIDIDNVDATIRMFSPDMDLSEIKPRPMPPRHAAYKGEVARIPPCWGRASRAGPQIAPVLCSNRHNPRRGCMPPSSVAGEHRENAGTIDAH